MGFHHGFCEVTLSVQETGENTFYDLGLDAREIVDECVSDGTRFGGKMVVGEGTREMEISVSGVNSPTSRRTY